MKNIVLIGLLLIFASCKSGKISSNQEKEQKPPNLIVIMTDDMGYADVGFNGCLDIPTPAIDRIANEGIRFTQGYVSFPVCGPSRAGFLTGRYQDRFGFTTNPSIDPNNPISGLPVEEETMAQVLRKADYKSAIVGKWHMGTNAVFHPLERGFDYFYGFLSGGHNYYPEELTLNSLSEVSSKWGWYRTKIIENRTPVETDDYLTDELSDAAVRFINRQVDDDQHFMLYLAYNAPHTPLQATEKYLSRFPNIPNERRKTYAAMISAVDDGVDRVLRALDKAGIDNNTIVVFLSDNGGASNNASDNGILRGRKGDLFEGGIRVPFAIRWKGVIPNGQTYNNPISSLDIMATIVAQADVKVNPLRPLDGVNLIPYLTGLNAGEPHDYLFWRKWEQNAMAIRHGNNKLVANIQQEQNPPELFDLSLDEAETNNIKSKEEDTYQSLLTEWQKWNDQLKDRVFPTLGEDEWWK
ncbi:MAG: sulfatase-like hydrolase/transferase [Bacteroidales bacterium]|nr:sulfatase-like hydrolase/transferase [Bacteroidales bacterium]